MPRIGEVSYVDPGPESSIPGGGGPGTPKKKKKRHPAPTPPPGPQPREPQQTPGTGGGSQPTDPQAPPYTPPPPVYTPPPTYEQQQYEKQARTYLQAQRIQAFSTNVIQNAPFLVGSLVFSGATNDSIRRIATGLDGAWAWLQQPLTPQVLARLLEMYPDRAALRQDILGTLADQTASNAQYQYEMGRRSAYLPGVQTLGRATEQGTYGRATEQPGGMSDYAQRRMAEVQNRLAEEDNHSILSWINRRLSDLGAAFQGEDPTLQRELNPALQRQYEQNPGGFAFQQLVGAGITPFAKPFEAGAAALGLGGSALDKPTIPGTDIRFLHPLHAGLDALIRPVSQTFQWISEESMKGGAVVRDALGFKAHTPEGDGIQNLAAFFIQWEVGKIGGHAAAAYHEARAQPKEITAPKIGRKELRAATEEAGLRGVKTPSAQWNARLSNTLIGLRGPLALLHEGIARSIYELASHPVDEWFKRGYGVRTRAGYRFARDVVKSNRRFTSKREGAGALVEQFPGLDPRTAAQLSYMETPNEVASYMIERVRKPAADVVAGKNSLVEELTQKLQDPTAVIAADERAAMRVEIFKARNWLNELKPDEAIFRVPKKSLWRSVQTGTGGRIVRFMNHLYDPVKAPGILNISRAFDDAPKSDWLWVPGAHGAPPDALTQNAAILTKMLRRLGVSNSKVRVILTKMSVAKGPTDFYDVLVRDVSNAVESSTRIAPDMKRAITERWKTDASERHKSFTSADPAAVQAAAEGGYELLPKDMLTILDQYGKPHAAPTQTSQLGDRIPFIDHELAIEATSYARRATRALRRTAQGGDAALGRALRRESRMAQGESLLRLREKGAEATRAERRRLRQLTKEEMASEKAFTKAAHKQATGKQVYTPKGLAARAVLLPLDVVHGLLDASTAIFKPLVLVTRSLGALPLRIQLEQGLRNFFMGYDPVVLGKKGFKEARYDQQLEQALGLIMREPLEPVGTQMRWRSYDFADQRRFGTARSEMTPGQLDAIHTQFLHARASSEVKKLVELGPDGFVEWATGERVVPPSMPALQSGNVRLFRGEGAQSAMGGDFFTDNPTSAARYGENVTWVDVPRSVADAAQQAARADGSVGYLLPAEYSGAAKPVTRVSEAVTPTQIVRKPISGTAQKFKQTFDSEWDRTLELKGLTWNEKVAKWADMKYAEMRDLAGGREDLLNAIASGRWSVRNGAFEDVARAELGKMSKTDEYNALLDERATLNDHIADPDLTPTQRRAYQDARLKVIDNIKNLENEGLGRDLNGWDVSLQHPEAFKEQLASEHMNEDYTPPSHLMGQEQGLIPTSKNPISAGLEARRAVQTWLYTGLKAASIADIHGTRGSLFYQIWRERFAQLAARYGTKDVEYLKTQAMWRAARETADLHYDLAARSSMHRALKNVFWFLPAYQEVLTTWFVKIPARYGQGIGQAYLANQANAVIKMLHATGVITKGPPSQDNPEGQDRIVLPLGKFFNGILPGSPFITEGPNKTIFSINPASLNLVASNLLPAIPPILAIPLGKLARDHGGAFKSLTDLFTFAGGDTAVFPSGINYLVEALTGEPSFLEPFSHDVLQNIHDSSFDDSLAMAYFTLSRQGVKPPDPADYADKSPDEFQAAKVKYYRQWRSEAESMFKGRYLVKAMGATLFPASLSVTSEYRESFMRTWWNITKGKPLADGLTPDQSAELEKWIEAHPGGMAYRVFRNSKGEPVKTLPYEATQLNDFYYTGELQALKPEDYMKRVMVMESNRLFSLQRKALTEGMTAPEVLLSYKAIHDKLDAINQAQEDWKRFYPSEWGDFQEYIDSFPDDTANQTIRQIREVERYQQVVDGLKAVAPLFTSGGMRDVDWRKILGQIQGALSDKSKYGEPTTAVAKGVAWYMNSIVSPYMNQTLPLYDRADQLQMAGDTVGAAKLYTEIRHINNVFNAGSIVGPDHLTYPNPEAYFFAHLTPVEQKRRVLHWVTEPVGWLTDWQRETAGLPEDPKYGKMFDWASSQDTWLENQLIKRDVSKSDTYYTETIEPWYTKWTRDHIQKQYGDTGLKLYDISQMPPYKRLEYVKFGASVPAWGELVKNVEYWTKRIIQPWPTRPDLTYSPEGDTSDVQKYVKDKLFWQIDQVRKENPQIDALFTDLTYAMAQSGQEWREGPRLYDALFFNNFDSSIRPHNPNIYMNSIGPGADRTAANQASPYADFHASQWPTAYQNGRIPLAAMVKVDSGNTPYAASDGGYYLRPDAAMSFFAMQQAAKKQGVTIPIANSYRTYDQQAAIVKTGVVSAEPGHSDHGLGLAFDLDGNDPGYTAARNWILSHAVEYGWINAAQSNQYGGGWSGNDPGHFSFYAGGGTGGGSGGSYGLPNLEIDRQWILAARQYVPNAPGQTTTVKAPTTLDNATANRIYARGVASTKYGWGQDQFKYVRYIVEGHGGVPGESHWLGSADNPTSSAIGIGQRLVKAHPWESPEERQQYLTSVPAQIAWFYDYIKARYGTPEQAWIYKSQHGGY